MVASSVDGLELTGVGLNLSVQHLMLLGFSLQRKEFFLVNSILCDRSTQNGFRMFRHCGNYLNGSEIPRKKDNCPGLRIRSRILPGSVEDPDLEHMFLSLSDSDHTGVERTETMLANTISTQNFRKIRNKMSQIPNNASGYPDPGHSNAFNFRNKFKIRSTYNSNFSIRNRGTSLNRWDSGGPFSNSGPGSVQT